MKFPDIFKLYPFISPFTESEQTIANLCHKGNRHLVRHRTHRKTSLDGKGHIKNAVFCTLNDKHALQFHGHSNDGFSEIYILRTEEEMFVHQCLKYMSDRIEWSETGVHLSIEDEMYFIVSDEGHFEIGKDMYDRLMFFAIVAQNQKKYN